MLFGKLLPREGNFFELFNQHAERIVEAARAFSHLVANYNDPHLREQYNRDVDNAEREVDITTGSGRVVLELPASFDGQLELETSYTENFGRETRIESDWDVEQDGPGGWDSSRGTPRRIITARGTAGNGRGRVRVRAVDTPAIRNVAVAGSAAQEGSLADNAARARIRVLPRRARPGDPCARVALRAPRSC